MYKKKDKFINEEQIYKLRINVLMFEYKNERR